MKKLELNQMVNVQGGAACIGLSFACGVGAAASLLTGGLGAILWGPSTIGLCAGAVVACNR